MPQFINSNGVVVTVSAAKAKRMPVGFDPVKVATPKPAPKSKSGKHS